MTFPETTDNSLFEALFVRALDVSGPLEKELKERGFDRRRPQLRYTSQTFLECLEAARRHRFPGLTPREGLKALGHAFVQGFRQTIIGKVMTAALPLLGPRTMLAKVPGRLQRLRSDMVLELEQRSPDEFVMKVRDAVQVGDFFAGVLEAALAVAGARGVTVTSSPRPDGYALTVALAG